MENASTDATTVQPPLTLMSVQIEGEVITPEEFHRRPGWLYIGSSGKVTTIDLQDGAGEPQASVDADIDLHINKISHGRIVMKEVIRASRMPLLPADEIEMVIRPRGGLDTANKGAASVASAIMAAVNIEKTESVDVMECPNFPQNMMAISAPSMSRTDKYARIQEITMQGITYAVSAYGTAAHGIVKGMIKGVPSDDNDRDIHEQTVTK